MGSEEPHNERIAKTDDSATSAGSNQVLTTPSLSLRQQKQQAVEKVLAMRKGEGEDSYSKNSEYQATANQASQALLEDAIGGMTLSFEQDPVIVADLGCSSGLNSIVNADFIVDKLRLRFSQNAYFQVFFNDLPSNDFNNLFQLLSNERRASKFFSAGVPGSYFGRLFPSSSVHVFHSSLCIQWLSKVPDAVLDRDSPSYNEGNPWISHARHAVAAAFQQQASLDMKVFLQARAAEMVSGGLLFFSFVGRQTAEPYTTTEDIQGRFCKDLVQIWSELVVEGLLTELQLDTFNIPCYLRSIEEIRADLESCGSLFNVVTVEMQRFDFTGFELAASSDASVISTKMTYVLKSIMSSLVEAHVGEKLAEVFWTRYQKLIEKRVQTNPENLGTKNSVCFVSLIRK